MGVVFVSYCREDADWRRRFVEMLKPVVRNRRLEVWSDDRNLVGEQWRPQLADAIGRSRVALLLVSPSFLASDFIMERELPALIEHGVQLVPVLVRPSLWDEVDVLEQLQWAHDPRRDGPVATSDDPDGQIVRVCKELLALLPDVPRPAAAPAVAAPAVAALERVERPGDLHGVPPLPAGYVARDELARLRAALVTAGDGAMGITGNAPLGLHGQGGIGKTVLAAALAHDEDVRRHFPDGVFWVTIGEQGDLVAAQLALLARLDVAHPELRSATQGLALLRAALADRRCLLVVDDVWSTAAAAAFRATGTLGRTLYTTRDAAVLDAIGSKAERIEVLSPRAARRLLASMARTHVDALPAETDRILEATGRAALALSLIGAAVARGGRTWQQVVGQLERGSKTFLDHPYANTFKAMQVGVATLDGALADAFRSLAVYPEDTIVPVAAVARYWRCSEEETLTRLEAFAARRLLTLDSGGFSFHDLQRDFLLLEVDELSLAHADLLSAYGGDWSALPHDEPYIWEHRIYHLRGAGDAAGIIGAVTDLAYLAVRAFQRGPYAAEADLREAAALDREPAVDWLLRVFTQWGHLLADHATPADLAVTLASRTPDPPAAVNAGGLDALLPEVFLTPRWGLPDAPPALTRVLGSDTGGLSDVAFSPDGRRLASAGDGWAVRLWDSDSGLPTATLEGHSGDVNGLAFAPDGRWLASAGNDGTVRLWDLAHGHATATLVGHTGWVSSVAFSPDARRLVSAGRDGTLRLWDSAAGRLTASFVGHTGWVNAVAFSPDARQLASAGTDWTVRLWDVAGEQANATLLGHTSGVEGVAFSPDGRRLASAGGDHTVRLWSVAGGRLAATLEGHTDWVRAVAFSPDGRQLASAGDDRTVRLWDAVDGRLIATLAGHADEVNGVAFSPDGRRLASAGSDGSVRLWDAAGGLSTGTFEGHTDGVNAVACSLDGRRVASAGKDGTVRVWDAAGGQLIAMRDGHSDEVNGVAFSPDGRRLASADHGETVCLWDVAGGKLTATLAGHSSWINDVAFSPDGRWLAGAGNDTTVRVWDCATGRLVATLEGHRGGVKAVAFSPDGRRLASAGLDETVSLWDPAGGGPSVTLDGHVGWVNAVAFSPDGRRLASAGDDATVRLWDLAGGHATATLEGHTRWLNGVDFSPDGRRLVSGGDDGTVRVWDLESGHTISRLKLGARVTGPVWGPSGITVAAHTSVIQLELTRAGGGPVRG